MLPTGLELRTGAESCFPLESSARFANGPCRSSPIGAVKTKDKRVCPVCGTLFADSSESCPVCALQGALKPESGASSIEDGTSELRFEHYRVLQNEDGTPIELGHGAMGMTYKAVDASLRRAVALKVIDARFVGDEAARQRFLREARAAASLRHPNVASVFHLGQSGDNYFYAMEFVEGETLDSLIHRCGRLEVNLALEIATQVTAGLAAVHKQKLVHRDIKPANIMVSPEERGGISAKIIDLGLAKALEESESGTAISVPGSFAGTPEFASPEQFAGVGVDTRSDLYSLGVVLWEMLTSKVPFSGSAAEVMYQHLNKPPPVERLKGVPQPVAVLLDMLLEKDPAHRFQTPNELLNAMPTVTRAIEAKRTIKHQKLRATFVQTPSFRQKESPAIRVPKRSIAVLPFASLSDEKRDAYFADGIQDEILSNLAKVSRLKVISRTSVMTYRTGVNRDLRSIAGALGVANVVEGTVCRDGNRVRITIRLVDARTDKALWSESYDRDLTDIFFVQSEIAQAVAYKLSVRLSPEERKGIEGKPTDDLEAYDLYLRARELIAKGEFLWVGEGDSRQNFLQAIGLLEAAIHLDSKFALAYCSLAKAHDDLYIHRFDRTPERRALGDTAVNEALRLRPDLPEVHLAAALHLCETYRNYERARVQVEIAAQGLPNSADVLWLMAAIGRRRGRWAENIRGLKKAVRLDPRNVLLLQSLATAFLWLRRYRDCKQTYDRLIVVKPDTPLVKVLRAHAVFRETADLPSFRNLLEKLPPSTKGEIDILSWRFESAIFARDWTNAHKILRESPNGEFYFSYASAVVPRGCLDIWLAQVQRRRARKGIRFVTARDELNRAVQACSEDAGLLSVLGIIDAALGRKEEAIREAKHATELLPISKDAWEGPRIVTNLAVVYAWTNELDLAFQQLAISVHTPGGISYGELKLDPAWDSLRKDPRFEKLLAELAPKD